MAIREVAYSDEMKAYFNGLIEKCNDCYEVAEKARAQGKDTETFVEIPQAEDLALRCEKILTDFKVGEIAEVIRDLTDEYKNRELVCLMAAKEIAKRPAESMELAIDRAIRVGLAVLTEGILVAPLEGLADTKIKSNADGTDYVDLVFAGPIRAAGGTAQAMSVLIADVVRQEVGIGKYIPTTQEIDRFIEEIPLYKQCQHLQYTPTPHEIQLIVGNCPICIDGEGTEKMEISGFRDLPRIDTNQVRGGACLVIAEGLCQKAAKIKKHVDKLGLKGWEFLDKYLEGKGASTSSNEERVLKPSYKYLKDMLAGRPIFGYPSRVGAFRLRYGRARTSGLASLAYSPASMYILDEFTALGTQVKIERPGKASVVTPCDQLDGPIVILKNGDLVQCNTKEEALAVRKDVKEITDTGEILVPFGEFCENNHFLVPCGYPIEWHKQELKKATSDNLPEDWLHPTCERAIHRSKELKVPLHPDFNLFWFDLDVPRLQELRTSVLEHGSFLDGRLNIPTADVNKRTLEDLGALHIVREGKIILDRYAIPLIYGLGLGLDGEKIVPLKDLTGEDALTAVSDAMGIEVRARARTRIGTRMGRPEKAKDRSSGKSALGHGLFAVTDSPEIGKSLKKAISTQAYARQTNEETLKKKGISANSKGLLVDCTSRMCPQCKEVTYRSWCRNCGVHTMVIKQNNTSGFNKNMMTIDITKEYHDALTHLGLMDSDDLKLTEDYPSVIKTPEPLEKAILRSKNKLMVYKDGTVRFDMTDIPITHFKPREIGLSIEKAKELGYVHDWNGEPLTREDQICELKVQDIIPNRDCGTHLVKVATFVDDLLDKFYGLKRYYNVKDPSELIGHLGIGLAPHTSGGILCRIIGYTDAHGCLGHPFFHAGKRRNCDGDEDCVMLLMDGLLNFSKVYIPSSRGGLMDTPLVLTTKINPNEIDKEAHNVDCLREYPLEFYEAAMQMKDAKEIEGKMDLVAGRIGTPLQYEGFGFTHDTRSVNEGPTASAYTILESMKDKMIAQLDLGRKIRAVDEKDEASMVVDKHFMPDMAGNLRSFSAQMFRCTNCNAKYRRMPMSGVCNNCGHELNLTVYEKSVRKYLEVSQNICNKYGMSDYTRERVEILSLSMDSLFNNDKVKKCKLTDFF